MKKIVFFLYSLGPGGAERVICQLSNILSKDYHVEILTIEDNNFFEDDLNEKVSIKSFSKKNIRSSLVDLYKYFRRGEFDIFFANIWPLTIIALIMKLFFKEKKVVVIEHCDIFAEFEYKNNLFKLLQTFSINTLYHFADKIIAVSNGVADVLVSSSSKLKNLIEVIYNPVRNVPIKNIHKNDFEYSILKEFSGLKIISVGRFSHQKNYPLLIKALKKIDDKNIKFLAYIIGEGVLRENIEREIKKLGLSSNVKCIGYKKDPREYLKISDVHVLSSIAEGFGLVIVEAMQAATTTVSTDCPSGPAEILSDQYGYLSRIDDIQDLADKIIFAYENKIDPQKLEARANDFHENNISRKYLKLIKGLQG